MSMNMKASSQANTTEDHKPPTGQRAETKAPVLLSAFPIQKLFPLPPLNVGIGQEWFETQGRSDNRISRTHLMFTRRGAAMYVQDLGSKNGTFVEGERLIKDHPVQVDDGDVLRVGGTLFVLRSAYEGPSEPQPALGGLVGPWGLSALRSQCAALQNRKDLNILIQGETGTGKELLAQYLAYHFRPGKSYTPINMSTFEKDRFDGYVFGWRRGSFSGALQDHPGIILGNAKGTVFFDEIGELALEIQPKLLRLLENRELMPMGAMKPEGVDVLILAATNRPLQAEDSTRPLKQDLLARFRARLHIPPLRERPEDIFAILEALWERERSGLPSLSSGQIRVDVEAIEQLMLDQVPDNVRLLSRLIQQVSANDFANQGLKLSLAEQVTGQRARPPKLSMELVQKALQDTQNNQSAAAQKLGVDRGKLLRFLKANSPK